MPNFWRKLLIILAPPVVIMGLVNYILDPSHMFDSSYVKTKAQSLYDMGEVEVSNELDYRSLQKYMIERMVNQPDIIIVGSSRGMEIDGSIFRDRIFFNSCQPAGSLKDMMGLFYLYEKRGIVPKTIILETDPWIFKRDADDLRWLPLYDEYYQVLKRIYQKDKIGTFKITLVQLAFMGLKCNKYFTLLSPAYFKLSLKQMFAILKERSGGKSGLDAKSKDIGHLYLDGSLHRSEVDENIASDLADKYAMNMITGKSMSRLRDQDSAIKKDYESFISYLTQNGIKVIILLIPIHPLTYDAINLKDRGIIASLEKEVNDIAEKNSIKVIGSYDPRKYGLKNTDFIDGVHPKKYVYKEILS